MSTTPYMNLSLPTPSVTPGPTYATMLNTALSTIDLHNHTSGYGVPIPSAGISINADLTFGGYNATSLKSARFSDQGSPLAGGSDLRCVYSYGGNLYYNDGSGNQVRITLAGAVDVSGAGSISGMGATTASVSYSSISTTFTFLQNTNLPALMAVGTTYIYDVSTTSGKYASLAVPAGLSANYSMTLPSGLPASQKIMTLDASGNIAAPYSIDNSTLEISANVIQIKDAGVTAAKIASDAVTTPKILNANVTRAKLEAVGQQISSSTASFNTASSTYVDVTNATVTITTTGRPVVLTLVSDGSGSDAYIQVVSSNTGLGNPSFNIQLLEGSTARANWTFVAWSYAAQVGPSALWPPSATWHLYAPAAGTYTYKLQAKAGTASTVYLINCKLVAYEL